MLGYEAQESRGPFAQRLFLLRFVHGYRVRRTHDENRNHATNSTSLLDLEAMSQNSRNRREEVLIKGEPSDAFLNEVRPYAVTGSGKTSTSVLYSNPTLWRNTFPRLLIQKGRTPCAADVMVWSLFGKVGRLLENLWSGRSEVTGSNRPGDL